MVAIAAAVKVVAGQWPKNADKSVCWICSEKLVVVVTVIVVVHGGP